MPPYGSASSRDTPEIEFGALCPVLKWLEIKFRIASEWEASEHSRLAKYYRSTAAGRKQLASEHSKWAEFVEAVAHVMRPAPEGVKR